MHHFKEGEIIYDEGDAGHEAYVVEKGVCVAYKYVWSTGKHEFVKGRLKVKTNLKEWKEMRRCQARQVWPLLWRAQPYS